MLIWQEDEWHYRTVTNQWALIVPKMPSCVCVSSEPNECHYDKWLSTIRRDAIVGQLMSQTVFRRHLVKRLTQKFRLEIRRYMIRCRCLIGLIVRTCALVWYRIFIGVCNCLPIPTEDITVPYYSSRVWKTDWSSRNSLKPTIKIYYFVTVVICNFFILKSSWEKDIYQFCCEKIAGHYLLHLPVWIFMKI